MSRLPFSASRPLPLISARQMITQRRRGRSNRTSFYPRVHFAAVSALTTGRKSGKAERLKTDRGVGNAKQSLLRAGSLEQSSRQVALAAHRERAPRRVWN